MGVQGLWELLAPVGRRVSVETLAGKKLAIDASIWMIQFMKAIRDERGEMVRNAHILGFFRRICKLLFLRTKPVFVFDGGTPALKRRTVIARRRHRDNARAKIRKTAEKLLLNHLKAQKLEEMANDIKDKQQKGDSKGKSVVLDDINLAENISERMETVVGTYNQQTVDELLAASLAAAEDEKFTGIALTSVSGVHSEGEDDGDGNEEMIFPAIHGKIDPMVLAALPPSMQLDLLVQMRERLMAENRQKYQKVKKAPTKFSELQIQAYLKTVAFRREIDEVQKSAAGRGVGGVQTSRIASEANREFIFSSSFIGDKQLLTSAGVEKIGAMERRTLREEPLSSGAMNCISSAPWVHSVTEAGATEPRTDFDHDVGTYLDERGRVRVSRVSGLGMRMTRDLQRNLDLMKELEQEKNKEEINSNSEAISNNEVPTVQKSIPENNYTVETSTGDEGNDDAISSIGKNDRALGNGKNCHSHEQSIDSVLGGKTSMEISFLEDSNEHKDTNDLFVGLVTGNTIMKFSSENISSKEHSHDFSSVSTWEKEMLEEKSRNFSHKNKEGSEPLIVESDATDEGEVDWEEGVCEVPRNDSSCQTEHEKEVSRFSLEEEPDIQEAIRRSLEDCTTKKPDTVSSENANLDISGEIIGQENTKEISRGMIGQENTIASPLQVLALEKDRFDSSTYMSLEEGVCDVPRNDSPCQTEQEKAVSRFSLEEEADIQEAIKRSLEDCTSKKPDSASSENANLEISGEIIGQENTKEIFRGMIGQEITIASPLQVLALGKDRFDSSTYMSLENSLQKSQISSETGNGLESLHNAGARDVQQNNNTPWLQSDGKELVTDEPCVRYQALSHEFPSQEGSEKRSDCVGLSHTNQITTPETMRFHRSGHGESFNTSNLDEMVGSFTGSTNSSKVSSDNPFAARGDVPDVIPVDVHKRDSQASHPCCSPETTNDSANFLERETDVDREQEPIAGKNYNFFPDNGNKSIDKRPLQDNLEVHIKASEASLDEEILLLRQERIDLGDEQRKLERNAESVSSEMFAECQELLQMFGLPYIIAPMEAEAQCAYMELTNQVDGVVTDDSDAFLFGARSVYKNIFDDRKYVETYFMKDIESELGLTRERLIHMALLLGSDYTEGVSGIGIVNAIEVVRAFPEEDGLQQFREWIESPDPAILGKIDAHAGKISRKRWSKVNKNETDALQTNVEGSAFDNSVLKGNNDKQTMDNIPNIKQIFMDKHRNVGKNWHIPSSFPSESVISAYSSPQVDKSTEPFSWGKPDLHLLRKLCWERFVWSNQKADELLVPVLKEYDKHETQLRLEAFYTFNERFAKIRSQRIKKAVKGITGNRSSELMDGLAQEASKSRKKRRVSPSESGENKSKKLSDMTNDSVDKNDSGASEKTDPKHPRKRNKSQEVETFQSKWKHRKQNAEKGSSVRGRGRGRGKNGSTIKSTEISSSDGEDDNQKEAQGEKTMELPELRRSARPRPHITYAAKDLDVDSLSESSNQSDGNCSDEMAVEQESLYNKCTVGDAPSLNEENQDDDPSPQDYLMSGGGFCTDDSNQNGDPIQLSTSPARTSDKLSNGGWIDASEAAQNLVFEPLSGNMDGLDVINEPPPENLPKLSTDEHRKIPCEHVKEINAGTEPVVVGEGANLGLSAMPYLRRRKRTK